MSELEIPGGPFPWLKFRCLGAVTLSFCTSSLPLHLTSLFRDTSFFRLDTSYSRRMVSFATSTIAFSGDCPPFLSKFPLDKLTDNFNSALLSEFIGTSLPDEFFGLTGTSETFLCLGFSAETFPPILKNKRQC